MIKILVPLLLIAFSLSAQSTIQWQKSLGGTYFDEATCIQQTDDGGYIVTGNSASTNGDVVGNHGVNDYWVVKLNSLGSVQWKKAFGGSGNDWPTSIQQTYDGGYIVGGFTSSNDGDVSFNYGDFDYWLVKLNSFGVVEWQKTYGGSAWDTAKSIQQTLDSGYIIAGSSRSQDGDLTDNHGDLDFWVLKINNSGEIEWQKSLGGSKDDTAYAVKQTSEGGYIVTGETFSNDGDVSDNHGNVDFWVVKLTDIGDLEWQKAFGGTALDVGQDVIQTDNGEYLVTGFVSSHNSGNVSGHADLAFFDFWVIKLSLEGDLLWQSALGGSGDDWARSIVETSDGNYVVAGGTTSSNGDVIGNDGGADFWIVKLSDSGEMIWQKTFGGSQADLGFSIQATTDNGYILAGYAWSNDGDVSGVHGYNDFWIVKLAPETSSAVEIPVSAGDLLEIFPNPAHQSLTIKTPSEEPSLEVRIYDLLGRQILHQNIRNGGDVDISAMTNGLYLVATQDVSGRIYTGKFLKI